VTDNAQSVFELAQTEHIPGIKEESNATSASPPTSCKASITWSERLGGNTFKATAKPVLIGTAVVGATTMIFAIILLLGKAGMLQLSLTDARCSWASSAACRDYWFCGASMQAVTTGAYSAVEYIKKNMDLTKKRRTSTTRSGREDLHAVRPKRHVEHLHRLMASRWPSRSSIRTSSSPTHLDRHLRPVPSHLHGECGGAWTTPKSTSKST